MNLKKLVGILPFVFVALTAGELLAQESASGDQPSMEEIMQEYMKLGQPGEKHEVLKPMAGTFKAANKYRMTPEAPWADSESEIEYRWILGGRILEQTVKTNMMGMEFEGKGWWGYDNIKKEYWNIWIDSMMTGTMITTGQMKDGAIVLMGEYPDAMDGMKIKKMKMVTRDFREDGFAFEMWVPDETGKLFLHFVSECARAKPDAKTAR